MSRNSSLAFLLLLLLSTGCASLTDRHQYVRVVPKTKNTEIFYDSEKVGVGPSTIAITRSKRPDITLKDKDQEIQQSLDTRYRWGQSFGGNLLIYPYTPAGWLIDWATGAAWEAEDIVDKKQSFPLNKHSKLLVLPTTNTSAVDSRHMGRKIAHWFEKSHKDITVLPFDENYYEIVGMGFDNESANIPEDADTFNELVHDTKATHIVFSDYDPYEKLIRLAIYSPYSGKVIKRMTLSHAESLTNKSDWNWIYSELFEMVPNTISIGTLKTYYFGCATQPDLTDRYCATNGPQSPLSYLSSISLTSILHFQKRKTWRVYLRLYPDFNLSYNSVTFDKADPTLPKLNLDWAYASLGYGPRLSFIVPGGEMFMELIPFYAMNYLRLYSPGLYDNTHYVGKVGLTFQLGFNTWIANHWNMRWFTKVQSQGLMENRDISVLDPNTQFSGGLTVGQVGVSLGYYFHEERTKFFDWLNLF